MKTRKRAKPATRDSGIDAFVLANADPLFMIQEGFEHLIGEWEARSSQIAADVHDGGGPAFPSPPEPRPHREFPENL